MKGIQPEFNLEIIGELVKSGATLKDLGKQYNVAPSSIGRAFRKLGITYNLQVRKIEKINR